MKVPFYRASDSGTEGLSSVSIFDQFGLDKKTVMCGKRYSAKIQDGPTVLGNVRITKGKREKRFYIYHKYALDVQRFIGYLPKMGDIMRKGKYMLDIEQLKDVDDFTYDPKCSSKGNELHDKIKFHIANELRPLGRVKIEGYVWENTFHRYDLCFGLGDLIIPELFEVKTTHPDPSRIKMAIKTDLEFYESTMRSNNILQGECRKSLVLHKRPSLRTLNAVYPLVKEKKIHLVLAEPNGDGFVYSTLLDETGIPGALPILASKSSLW